MPNPTKLEKDRGFCRMVLPHVVMTEDAEEEEEEDREEVKDAEEDDGDVIVIPFFVVEEDATEAIPPLFVRRIYLL